MSSNLVAIAYREPAWDGVDQAITIGKDILELLSSSMYLDPMTVYREYVQNATDSIDTLQVSADTGETPRIEIVLDQSSRVVTIRDFGAGLEGDRFLARMLSFGASEKRGTPARGFRGVGRLSGLGYCQELVFRSRTSVDAQVSELRWDCRALKTLLRSADRNTDMTAAVRQVVRHRRMSGSGFPCRFFEVELKGLVRHRNDQLLSPQAVSEYLSQVAPVAFDSRFPFKDAIEAHLSPHIRLGNVAIVVNGNPIITRPHIEKLNLKPDVQDEYGEIELITLEGMDGQVAAVGWLAHHGYSGALPTSSLVRGLRLRVGNIQVGDDRILEHIFPEPRFNSWTVGELHIIDSRILPNGRRDHFEQGVHFDNILNRLAPTARDVARRCRVSSVQRKWRRDFELGEQYIKERLRIARQGVLTKDSRTNVMREIKAKLVALRELAAKPTVSLALPPDWSTRLRKLEQATTKLADDSSSQRSPLRSMDPQKRRVVQSILSLVYECSSNKSNAKALVDKVLVKLASR